MNQSNPCSVACLSGGLDSTSLLLHQLARGWTVHGLSFDYGQRHRVELQCLARNLAYLRSHNLPVEHHVLDVSAIGQLLNSSLLDAATPVPLGYYEQQNMRSTVVPNRNAIFASIAYGHALSLAKQHLRGEPATFLALGVHSGDHAIYPDCRPKFYEQLMAAFQAGNWESDRVQLYLPYLQWDKKQILQDAQRSIETLGLDFETVFRNTSTSYDPDSAGRAHGLTGSDVERILAFHDLGIRDPIEYQRPWPELVERALQLRAEHLSN